MASEQFSLRLAKGTKERLEALAKATGRTKAFLAQDAIEKYLEIEAWQINAIQDSLKAIENQDIYNIAEIKKEWDVE